jgi:hypothetical protein
MYNKLSYRILLAAILSLLIASFTPGTLRRSNAYAASGRGVICNRSSVTIWLTVEENKQWTVRSLAPGACSNPVTQDVEALWGRQCNTSGQCWYQTWKLGDGGFWVTNYLISPIPPGRILKINGAGVNSGWSRDSNWPAPSLNSIGYGITR